MPDIILFQPRVFEELLSKMRMYKTYRELFKSQCAPLLLGSDDREERMLAQLWTIDAVIKKAELEQYE